MFALISGFWDLVVDSNFGEDEYVTWSSLVDHAAKRTQPIVSKTQRSKIEKVVVVMLDQYE